MKLPTRNLLHAVVEHSAEPTLLLKANGPDWVVVLCNPALTAICPVKPAIGTSVSVFLAEITDRDTVIDVSEVLRGGKASVLAFKLACHEYLLAAQPIATVSGDSEEITHFALYWRPVSVLADKDSTEVQHALLKAKRKLKDLRREDAVTGMLNERTFKDLLKHDIAVAAREKSELGLLAFSIEGFEDYLQRFGEHATNSCLRRVAKAIRRSLKRASDIAGRINDTQNEIPHLVVLSHGNSEKALSDFARQVANSVEGLGIHHPGCGKSRFVNVTFKVAVCSPAEKPQTASKFIRRVLN